MDVAIEVAELKFERELELRESDHDVFHGADERDPMIHVAHVVVRHLENEEWPFGGRHKRQSLAERWANAAA